MLIKTCSLISETLLTLPIRIRWGVVMIRFSMHQHQQGYSCYKREYFQKDGQVSCLYSAGSVCKSPTRIPLYHSHPTLLSVILNQHNWHKRISFGGNIEGLVDYFMHLPVLYNSLQLHPPAEWKPTLETQSLQIH